MLIDGAGRLIQETREGAGLSQIDLSRLSGVSIGTISNIENGRNKSPRRRTVYALCKALSLDSARVLARPVEVAAT